MAIDQEEAGTDSVLQGGVCSGHGKMQVSNSKFVNYRVSENYQVSLEGVMLSYPVFEVLKSLIQRVGTVLICFIL